MDHSQYAISSNEKGLSRRSFIVRGSTAFLLAPGVLSLFPELLEEVAAAAATQVIPGKEKLIHHNIRPKNLEARPDQLNTWITPVELHYVRDHYPTPQIDVNKFRLRIEGEVARPLSLSMSDLRQFEEISHVVTLECAGNGRGLIRPKVRGNQWTYGAVATARWTGVRMADVLRKAGVKSNGMHVVMDGADAPTKPGKSDFTRSIPIGKALDPNTMLAYKMYGKPIPPIHGFPLRAIIPSWIGSANVKFLSLLRPQSESFKGRYMTSAYRVPKEPLVPGNKLGKAWKEKTVGLTGLKVKSIIAFPAEGNNLKTGFVSVIGLAWAGESQITRVDVSTDGGKSWVPARLVGEKARYAWRMWEYAWDAKPGSHTLLARAADSAGRVQPLKQLWNDKGYGNNQVHAVKVKVG